MNPQNALIIFTKNAEYGKVKTRLAATAGDDKAFEVYHQLIDHTHLITQHFPCNKIVYYADFIEQNDIWNNDYAKAKQKGIDLGERMCHAFNDVFQQRYFSVIIIGTDCPMLTAEIIDDAFEHLKNKDIVIGAAADGGYYLIGMKTLHTELFKNIKWSTANVFNETVSIIKTLNLNYFVLPCLHDVDEEKDLQYMKTI